VSVLTFTRHQHPTAVCRGGDLHKYQGTGTDALQRPLRSRFRARLTASVRRLESVENMA
jgi:hypothetical protein